MGSEPTRAGDAAISDRLILRGPITASSWLGGETKYEAVASATVVEVIGRSVRVRIDEVTGLPRKLRAEAAELMEGWHRLDDLGVKRWTISG